MTLRIVTETDLQAAIDDGLLEERHAVDIKRELPPKSDSANKSLAQDLAAFAINGGQLVIGVDEGPPIAPWPVPLAGLPERVESVALGRVSPPLQVRTTSIPALAKPGHGYLLVNVPASPMAPHMVDHVYYARSDKRNYRLADAEVQRLVDLRRRWQHDMTAEVRALIAADPLPQDHGHLFVIAAPLAPARDLLRPRLEAADWYAGLRELVGTGELKGLPGYVPNIDFLGQGTRTARGAALQTSGFGTRDVSDRESARVELTHQGAVRILCGRGRDTWQRDAPTIQVPIVVDQLVIGWCAQTLRIALAVGAAEGFSGTWQLGVGLTQMLGAYSWTRRDVLTPSPPFPEPDYVETARATTEEIEQSIHEVLNRLVGRLMVGLDSRNISGVAEFLEAPKTP
jgi:hypothetical protein